MDISERKVAEEAIWRSEAYLAEPQKLSHIGSFGWKVSSGEIFWSDETFRIFACDLKTKPTLEFVLSRVHPDDHELVRQIDRASRDGEGFALEHRLQLPGGSTVSPYPIPERTVGLGPGIQFGGQGIWFRANSYMETDVRNRPSAIKMTFRISKALPTAEQQP